MARWQKDSLRTLALVEPPALEHPSRSRGDPAAAVARVKDLLTVADRASYQVAAQTAGRRSDGAIAQSVARFNRQRLATVVDLHHGDPPKHSTQIEHERILQEVCRQPDREEDGTGTWSLPAVQRGLFPAPDGLPTVSTYTKLLQEAGFRWS